MDVMREQYDKWREARTRIFNAKPKLRSPDTRKRIVYLDGSPEKENAIDTKPVEPPKIKLSDELKAGLYNVTSRSAIVVKRICELRGITETQLKSIVRQRSILEARAEVAVCLRSVGYTTPKIAFVLNRDHSSILHLLKKYGKELTDDKKAEYGFPFLPPEFKGSSERLSDASLGDESIDAVSDAFGSCEL